MVSLAFCQGSNNFPHLTCKGAENYYNFAKARVKLFPNFTRYHFITVVLR